MGPPQAWGPVGSNRSSQLKAGPDHDDEDPAVSGSGILYHEFFSLGRLNLDLSHSSM